MLASTSWDNTIILRKVESMVDMVWELMEKISVHPIVDMTTEVEELKCLTHNFTSQGSNKY